MIKLNTNVSIERIANELEVGRSIDLEYNEARFTFTKENSGNSLYPNLRVQYDSDNFGELIVSDDLATKYIYRDYEDDSEYDIKTLEQLYGLSLLFLWKERTE